MNNHELKTIWNAFLACRTYRIADLENFYRDFIGALYTLKKQVQRHYEQSNPPIDYPKSFISYAWPHADKEHPDCQRMHTLLRFLEAIIEYLTGGHEQVFLDLGNMQGNINEAMYRNLAASQFVLLIGTQKLKTRVTDEPDSSISREFQQIVARMRNDPQANFLLPIMLEADYRSAFAGDDISHILIRDCRSGLLDKNLSVAGLRKLMSVIFSLSGPCGIVPTVFDIEGKRRKEYSPLAGFIERSAQILGETGAPVMAAVGRQGLFQLTVTANDRVNRRAKDVRMSCQVSPDEINGVLNAVGLGNIDQVTDYLDRNPALCYVQGVVKDVADRRFNKITVFQYALWAGDIPMCQAILERLPQKDAANQMNALEHHSPDISNTHGTYFTFEPTIQAYKTYCDNYDGWDYNQCKKYWCETIGGFQKTWPAWVRYKMSEPGLNAAWTKKSPTQAYVRTGHRSERLDMTTDKAWVRGQGGCEARPWLIVGHRVLHAKVNVPYDHICIENEQKEIAKYRETLCARFAALSHGNGQCASQSPR